MRDLTCYIVDNEHHVVEMLSAYIRQTAGLKLHGFATDPLLALKEITAGRPPDVVFLDVNMPGLSGLELAGLINLYTTVVFVTAFERFALQAFEKEAFDFILKPVRYARFYQCVQRLRLQLERRRGPEAERPDFFFVKSAVKGRMIKIMKSDIVFVEGLQNYVKIHLRGETVIAYLTLLEVAQFLPPERFLRIHHSFIINLEHISAVEQSRVTLDNHTSLNLGRHYKEAFLEKINSLLLKSKRQL
jgi:DNA-binding LytR/AlgR family response regulator